MLPCLHLKRNLQAREILFKKNEAYANTKLKLQFAERRLMGRFLKILTDLKTVWQGIYVPK